MKKGIFVIVLVFSAAGLGACSSSSHRAGPPVLQTTTTAISSSTLPSASTTMAATATVPVASCPTTYGLERDLALSPPQTMTIHGVVPGGVALKGYSLSNGSLVVVGPSGWACDGAQGTDGGRRLAVYPEGRGAPKGVPYTPDALAGIVVEIPAGAGGVDGRACPLFATAAANDPIPCQHRPPPGEVVTRTSPTVVIFEDPPGVAGDGVPSGGDQPAHGVIVYRPAAQPGPPAYNVDYAAIATCTLPASSPHICTVVLNDFLARYGQR